jgi:hypothetical protein
VRRSEKRTAARICTRDARGTTLVPTATSDASRSSTPEDDADAGDARGRIYT